jgi:hypothetical protein
MDAATGITTTQKALDTLKSSTDVAAGWPMHFHSVGLGLAALLGLTAGVAQVGRADGPCRGWNPDRMQAGRFGSRLPC